MRDKINLSSAFIKVVWSSLNEPIRHPVTSRAQFYFLKVAKAGWAFYSDIEEIFKALDNRVPSSFKFLKEFTKTIGINWEQISYKPTFVPDFH